MTAQLDLLAPPRGADISGDGRYRYELWRRWKPGPVVTWCMLNPSTADAEVDDPTIRRCIGFARIWGFAGIRVVNLYAWRATSPRDLRSASKPVGPRNDAAIAAAANNVILDGGAFVCAWGSLKRDQGRRAAAVLHILAHSIAPQCLGTTRDGHPRHPLYVRGDTERVPFSLPPQPGETP